MEGRDGDEWMIYSDSMVMGRNHNIMDSSLVFSPFVLLFARAVLIEEKKGHIRFDRWWAEIQAIFLFSLQTMPTEFTIIRFVFMQVTHSWPVNAQVVPLGCETTQHTTPQSTHTISCAESSD